MVVMVLMLQLRMFDNDLWPPETTGVPLIPSNNADAAACFFVAAAVRHSAPVRHRQIHGWKAEVAAPAAAAAAAVEKRGWPQPGTGAAGQCGGAPPLLGGGRRGQGRPPPPPTAHFAALLGGAQVLGWQGTGGGAPGGRPYDGDGGG
eukprot:CAMPEP_0206380790 /NCGR_PEP_ID=MMETSP0294-20121207/12242_1 /ASSEMBLY_ACC=CAM_ASM_000327 /TAXON_ID=39354 /ORGANISM="Heterosigma akashiwo, Strain CCMP2393" /LENGTH=146 /DNA_ID=CAMNT_0053830083 /DNA_START=304 /DNA_END=743 /DNA_ORIENTATION=+